MGVGLIVFNGSFVLKISPIGDLLTLLAALSWAFYSLIIKKMAGRYPTIFITRKIFFYGVLTILPAFLLHPLQPDTAVLLPVSYTHLDVYKRQVRSYIRTRRVADDTFLGIEAFFVYVTTFYQRADFESEMLRCV